MKRLARYERFPDQAINPDGDFIREVMMMAESGPIDLYLAMNDSNRLVVMQEELGSTEKNKTWDLIEKSMKKPIDVMWVYKLNLRLDGEIVKHKVILVARDFLQKPSIDFNEVYAIVTRMESTKIVVSATTYIN